MGLSDAVCSLVSVVQLLVVLAFLVTLSSQVKGNSSKNILVHVEPDNYTGLHGCETSHPLTFDENYELRVKSDHCETCKDTPFLCTKDSKTVCTVVFRPASEFVRIAMKVCANAIRVKISSCNNTLDLGTFPKLRCFYGKGLPTMVCQKRNASLTLVYRGHNYCGFEGPVYIKLKPLFYRLTYECPSKNIFEVEGKLMSYSDISEAKYGCSVSLRPPGGFKARRFCMAFIYFYFSHRTIKLKVKHINGVFRPEIINYSQRDPPSLTEETCIHARASSYLYLTEVKISMKNTGSMFSKKTLRHSFVLSYRWEPARDSKNSGDIYREVDPHGNNDDDDDDDDDDDIQSMGFKSTLIIAFSSCFVFCFFCGIICHLCRSSNHNSNDASENYSNSDGDHHIADSHDGGPRPASDVAIVHCTVRGTLQALNPQDTLTPSSRTGSPTHIPMADSNSASQGLLQGEEEMSSQPSAPPMAASAMPPPSYESLFPRSS